MFLFCIRGLTACHMSAPQKCIPIFWRRLPVRIGTAVTAGWVNAAARLGLERCVESTLVIFILGQAGLGKHLGELDMLMAMEDHCPRK